MRKDLGKKHVLLAVAYAALAAVVGLLIYGALNPATSPKVVIPVVRPHHHAKPKKPKKPPDPFAQPIGNQQRFKLAWPTGRSLRLLMVGDSLLSGYYATTPARAFGALVTGAIQRHGQVEQHVDVRVGQSVGRFVGDSFPSAADVAVVELGTNDRGYVTPVAEFARSYRAVINQVRSASPAAKIVCLSLWQPSSDHLSAVFDDRIASICPGSYVDLTRLWDAARNRGPVGALGYRGSSDNFYPNDAGHAAIANAVLHALGL